jgi:predicted alpha/beta superfamily hydrolase
MKPLIQVIILLFGWLIGVCQPAYSQSIPPVALPGTELRPLVSKALTGETYQLLVHRPDGYDPRKTYNVLIVLDGVGAFSTAINCLGILHGECDKSYNEPILIGISDGAEIGKPGNKRDRDFTPTAFKTNWGSSGGGGGPAFLQFIEQEVIPYIEKHYSVNKNRAIYGYSYGGLFTSYVLLTKPQLFKTVLIGSPSLFADNGVIFRTFEPDYAQKHTDLPTNVWLSVGEKDEYLIDDTHKFADLLKSRNYPSLRLKTATLSGLNHLTGIQPTMLQAFKWAYCETSPNTPKSDE